jgi:protein tyrosine phosphatase/rhodanese-related sulfurtransferase
MLSPSSTATASQTPSSVVMSKDQSLPRTGGENGASRSDYFSNPTQESGNDENCRKKTASPEEQSTTQKSQHPWHSLFGKAGPMTSTHMPLSTPFSQASTNRNKEHNDISSSSRALSAGFSHSLMSRVQSNGSIGSSRSGSSILPPEELSKFRALEASKLAEALLDKQTMQVDGIASRKNILILDIRPSTSFSSGRIKGSINICAPSTLLKRTGVTVDRIEEEMLSAVEDQKRFSGWRKGPSKKKTAPHRAVGDEVEAIETIVVLDTDTRNIMDAGKPAAGGGGTCLTGLLRKFDQAGFDGSLWWLVGGFEDFSKHASGAEEGLIERSTLVTSSDVSKSLDSSGARKSEDASYATDRRSSVPNIGKASRNGDLKLPNMSDMRTNSLVQPKGLPMEAFMSSSTARGKAASLSQLSSGILPKERQHQSQSLSSMDAANPFFDNIRQNRELQHGITETIPLSIPDMSESEARRLPEFLSKLRQTDAQERAEKLAQSFYEVEQAERDRLMTTMQRHADESDCKNGSKSEEDEKTTALRLSEHSAVSPGTDGHAVAKSSFPFSIAAALERGGENRYNNIWTYEHSRVRCPQHADYLNGSYIEPARQFGCKRRYIATQAPLPSTFDTYWSVIWQQNVHTICMVTREFESGRVQSHNYWISKRYGALDLTLIEEIKLDGQGNLLKEVKEDRKKQENYFGMDGDPEGQDACEPSIIRRKLRLRDDGGKERVVTQFHFVAWPDYSVPDRPEDLLVLIRLCSDAQHSADLDLRRLSNDSMSSSVGPLVVHCSAGVGRTGTFIVVDSTLDVIRRQRWAQLGRPPIDTWDSACLAAGSSSLKQRKSITRLADDSWNSRTSTPQQRKNLKRELSPSAMDLDTRARSTSSPTRDSESDTKSMQTSESGRDIASPPPTRRSRPDSDADSLSIRSSSPTSMYGSSMTSNALSFGAISVDGPQTPSTALGQMSLTSSGTPSRGRLDPNILQHQGLQAITSDSNGKPSPPKSAETLQQADTGSAEGVDLIRTIVDTMREQRMSMVQTTRQFVFAYTAVICGTLDEIRREESSS